MPSWIVHLATANKIIEKINIKNVNSFLIGNIIPDAERHVIKDFSVYVPYHISHYSEIQVIEGHKEELPNIDKIMKNYKEYLYNPMVLGYITHILTDYYWNRLAFLRYTIKDNEGNCIGVKLNNGNEIACGKEERNELKRNDFKIFKNYIVKKEKYVIPKYEDRLLEDIKLIKEIPFNKEDINKIIKHLNEECKEYNQNISEYNLFTQNQIIEDYKNSIEFIMEFFKENISKK